MLQDENGAFFKQLVLGSDTLSVGYHSSEPPPPPIIKTFQKLSHLGKGVPKLWLERGITLKRGVDVEMRVATFLLLLLLLFFYYSSITFTMCVWEK